jgi:hypothetical protein
MKNQTSSASADTGVNPEAGSTPVEIPSTANCIVPPASVNSTVVEREGFNDRNHTFVASRHFVASDDWKTPMIVLPAGHTALHFPQNMRISHVVGQVVVPGRDQFMAYLKRYVKQPGNLAVYADASELQILGILDHPDLESGDCKHRIVLQAHLTPVMKRWEPNLNKFLPQDDFVSFVDAEVSYFLDGSKLLALATNFCANESMTFKSIKRLEDGTFNVAYSTALSVQNEEPLPSSVSAAIQVYEGGPSVKLTFKLRYRIQNGKLAFQLFIPELADIKRREFDTLVGQIREDIHETEGWENVLVISGGAVFTNSVEIKAVAHQGLPLPTPIVASGAVR